MCTSTYILCIHGIPNFTKKFCIFRLCGLRAFLNCISSPKYFPVYLLKESACGSCSSSLCSSRVNCACSLPCMCIVCDSIHQESKLFSQVKLKEYCVRRQGGDGDGGEGRKESKERKGKKKPRASQQSPRSAWTGTVTSGSSLDSLDECRPLFSQWPLGCIYSSAQTWAKG